MKPVVLTTERLYLDQPTPADRDLVVEYCRDPLFETYLTTPWPYEPEHADTFIEELVPKGWAEDTEYTWAIRKAEGGELLGMMGYRTATRDVGYWLGAPHRRKGYTGEAVAAMTEWVFGLGEEMILWECVVGNTASASVARKLGFSYAGEAPSALAFRDGSHPLAWHGELQRVETRETEWPIP